MVQAKAAYSKWTGEKRLPGEGDLPLSLYLLLSPIDGLDGLGNLELVSLLSVPAGMDVLFH